MISMIKAINEMLFGKEEVVIRKVQHNRPDLSVPEILLARKVVRGAFAGFFVIVAVSLFLVFR